MKIIKEKSIGKVLFIVEGEKTEPYILWKIFCKIFDYQLETNLRGRNYKIYNSQTNPDSRVYVVNAEESNIKHIDKDNNYLNNLFLELINNYDFDLDNAAIFYIFDRDDNSNTDSEFIRNLMATLSNSRDNPNYIRQGLLLLSYPSIESFTLSCFKEYSFEEKSETGSQLKKALNAYNINHDRISEEELEHAVKELLMALDEINECEFDLEDFSQCNHEVFEFEESYKSKNNVYKCLSLFVICLLDLGLIEVEHINDDFNS